jgi:hypothetical protein
MPGPDRAHIQAVNDATYAAWNRWIVTAVHSGDFLGLAATGNAIRVAGCTFSHFDEQGSSTATCTSGTFRC